MNNISIIIPVYNQHSWMVQEAINSCLNQTGNVNVEIVLVDDGSDTEEKWYDNVNMSSNVSFYKLNKNCGVAAAWNYGIKKSKYDIICPMACDDFFHPDKTETQLSYMDQFKIDFSYTGYREQFLDASNQIISVKEHRVINVTNFDGVQIFNKLTEKDYCNNFINGATVIMSKELFNQIGKYDERLRYKQDYDLWLRIAKKHKILGVPHQLMTRRIHNNQAKRYFANNVLLNEQRRRTEEYAIIKLKWENSVYPVQHPSVDTNLLNELGYK